MCGLTRCPTSWRTAERCRSATASGSAGFEAGARTFFVRAFGVSTGFDMPMRALTFYERDGAPADQAELALGGVGA